MEIKDYDSRIRDIKWADSINEEEFNLELSTCERYVDQINEILAFLTDRPNVTSDNSSRSLLKNPVIPLPVFQSSPDENIDKFFQEFESVSVQQAFSERDKFLLQNKNKGRKGKLFF